MIKVSILIPCYNAEKWIKDAIQSALDQTWPDKEVIVVDDGSKDGSLEVIKSFGDRVYWETGPNRGGNVARNRLMELARGEWLQYLDADDYLLPKKIETDLGVLNQMPNADLIFSPVVMEYHSEKRREILPIPTPHDYWGLLALWELPQTGAALWRKQSLLDVGGWKNDQPCCQEHELYLRLLMSEKKFAFNSSAGAVYRQWSDQTLCNKDPMETRKKRLEIESSIESFLKSRGELTQSRLKAINQARLETARSSWDKNPDFSISIAQMIKKSFPQFTPLNRVASPLLFRIIYFLFDYEVAERVAMCVRNIKNK